MATFRSRTYVHSCFSLIALGLMAQFIFPSSSPGLQTPPDLFVNHQTKECALLYRGSVCTTCVPPEGWVEYSKGPYGPCPAGYVRVELKPVCYSSKSSFCCTEGHSGAPGHCKDMVINRSTQQCAFVNDIDACVSLPKEWQRPKAGVLCPFKDHVWISGEIVCETKKE